MLSNALLFSKINKRNFFNSNLVSYKTFAEIYKKINLNGIPKENYTKEQKASYDQHVESFKKFVDFMSTREQYSWDDYLEQVIVSYF
jgi:hypothetical protein